MLVSGRNGAVPLCLQDTLVNRGGFGLRIWTKSYWAWARVSFPSPNLSAEQPNGRGRAGGKLRQRSGEHIEKKQKVSGEKNLGRFRLPTEPRIAKPQTARSGVSGFG